MFIVIHDIISQVNTVDYIQKAKDIGIIRIILGWHITDSSETKLVFLRLFRDLGVRVMQLTYNTQNLVGSGCWESEDRGLSDYGRDVIDMMNELGITIDLSHVGEQTARDAIEHSSKPVSFTHVAPRGLHNNPRNKSDALLKFGADNGAFIGASTYPPFLPSGNDTTVADCVHAFDYMIDLVGEDTVGIGTDFTEGHGEDFFSWLRSDKGYGSALTNGFPGLPPNPIGFDGPAEYPTFIAALVDAGLPDNKLPKLIREQPSRVLRSSLS